jgi:uncharacterized protein (DUF58 family)
MKLSTRFANWLETRWASPSYSGGVLLSASVFFFIAATNTLAGWLYVMSGVTFALLTIAALLSSRTLKGLKLRRRPIVPVSAGEVLTVELLIENPTPKRRSLLQVTDLIPSVLGKPVNRAIEIINPESAHYWVYQHPSMQRGIYRWHTVQLRTGAPLGLFWCRRDYVVDAIATVYPKVLPLSQCPLIDELGQEMSFQMNHDRRAQASTEGLTRSLRPYRWGDPTRSIHWRTSARYGELRVRELETFTSEQEVLVCLDSARPWQSEAFEQAVTIAASLYFYAHRRSLNIRLWTAGAGLIAGEKPVLETLAAIQANETARAATLPNTPIIWLTQNPDSLNTLSQGSRWVLWGNPSEVVATTGIVIDEARSLTTQLQERH